MQQHDLDAAFDAKIALGEGQEVLDVLDACIATSNPDSGTFWTVSEARYMLAVKVRLQQQESVMPAPNDFRDPGDIRALHRGLVEVVRRNVNAERNAERAGVCLIVTTPDEARQAVRSGSLEGIPLLRMPRSVISAPFFRKTLLGASILQTLAANKSIKPDIWDLAFGVAVCFADGPSSYTYHFSSGYAVSSTVSGNAVSVSRIAKAARQAVETPNNLHPHDLTLYALASASRHCASCNQNSTAALKCGGCRRVYYCNKACQRAHWNTHRAACSTSQPKRK